VRRRARAVERAISAIATSLALREIPLQPSVPVAEQRADPRCDNRRQQPQRGPQLEGEAIAHKGFGITAWFESGIVIFIHGRSSSLMLRA